MKVVYPDVLLHVGVIKILPEPGPVTPVKVPLSVTPSEEKQSSKCQIQAAKHCAKKRLVVTSPSYSLLDLHPAWSLPQHISDGVDEATSVTHTLPLPEEMTGRPHS